MPPRRPHEPLPPKADEIYRLAKRVISIYGDQYGHYRAGRLSVRSDSRIGVIVNLHHNANTWDHVTVFRYERDWAYEQKQAVNHEFMRLGIPMKGGAQYWSLTEFDSDQADEVIRIMNQVLVLEELSRVLDGDADAETA